MLLLSLFFIVLWKTISFPFVIFPCSLLIREQSMLSWKMSTILCRQWVLILIWFYFSLQDNSFIWVIVKNSCLKKPVGQQMSLKLSVDWWLTVGHHSVDGWVTGSFRELFFTINFNFCKHFCSNTLFPDLPWVKFTQIHVDNMFVMKNMQVNTVRGLRFLHKVAEVQQWTALSVCK